MDVLYLPVVYNYSHGTVSNYYLALPSQRKNHITMQWLGFYLVLVPQLVLL